MWNFLRFFQILQFHLKKIIKNNGRKRRSFTRGEWASPPTPGCATCRGRSQGLHGEPLPKAKLPPGEDISPQRPPLHMLL